MLCTGQQFQVPAPTGADIDTGVTNENLPGNPNHRLLVEPPKNLYLVNDMYDAAVGLYRAENTLLKNQSKFGGEFRLFSCINVCFSSPQARNENVGVTILFW